VFWRVRDLLFDPRDIQIHAAVRRTAARLDLAHDAARHVVAREQFGRPASSLVALGVPPAFFRVSSRLGFVVVGNVAKHEAIAFAVLQHAAFTTHALGDEDALHAGWPHHAGGMELHKLHVDEFRARAVRQPVAVARAFPAVARDAIGPAHATGGQDHGLGREHMEPAPLAVVRQRACDTALVHQQVDDGVLHVDGHAQIDGVVLQSANQLKTSSVAHVSQPGVAMAAEIALQDLAVGRAVEHCAPRFEFAHPIGRFLGVQLRHAPVVDVLAAAHGVGEMHFPVVAVVHVAHGRGHAAFSHHGVGLAEQRLADEAHRDALAGRFNGSAKTRAPGADHEHIVGKRIKRRHQKILRSVMTPIEHRRTYRSEDITENRLHQAKS